MTEVSTEEYQDAVDSYIGWCTECKAFIRERTEPDADHYDCPTCGRMQVMGAEQALLVGEIELKDDE